MSRAPILAGAMIALLVLWVIVVARRDGKTPPPPPPLVLAAGAPGAASLAALTAEHALLWRMCDALDGFVAASCGGGGGGAAGDAGAFARFLREYADAFHHAKEEGVVFPAVAAADGGGGGGAARSIAALAGEHVAGRARVAEISAAAATGDCGRLAPPAAAYVALLRRHIVVEDGTVFPELWRGMSAEVRGQVDGECALLTPDPDLVELGEGLIARWTRGA
jgi:hemerythrin-like domain-containing protein